MRRKHKQIHFDHSITVAVLILTIILFSAFQLSAPEMDKKEDKTEKAQHTLLASTDLDGVNLIAIQAIEKRIKDQQSRIIKLETKLERLEKLLDMFISKDEDKIKVILK